MKAILMKVNYDRKYVEPHKGGYEPLQTRINLTREIYHNPSKDKKLLKESLEEAAKRKLRQHEHNRLVKHSSPNTDKLIDRYKRKSAESLRTSPQSRLTLVSGGARDDTPVKLDKATEGSLAKDGTLVRAPHHVKLQPIPCLPPPNKSILKHGNSQTSENSTPVNDSPQKFFLPRLQTSITGNLPDRVKKAYSSTNSSQNAYSMYKGAPNRVSRTATGLETPASKGTSCLGSASGDSFYSDNFAPKYSENNLKGHRSEVFNKDIRQKTLDDSSYALPLHWSIPRPVRQKTSIIAPNTERAIIRRDSLTSFILARSNSCVSMSKQTNVDVCDKKDVLKESGYRTAFKCDKVKCLETDLCHGNCHNDQRNSSIGSDCLYYTSFESSDSQKTSDDPNKNVHYDSNKISDSNNVPNETQEMDSKVHEDTQLTREEYLEKGNYRSSKDVAFLEDNTRTGIEELAIRKASEDNIQQDDKEPQYFTDIFDMNKQKNKEKNIKTVPQTTLKIKNEETAKESKSATMEMSNKVIESKQQIDKKRSKQVIIKKKLKDKKTSTEESKSNQKDKKTFTEESKSKQKVPSVKTSVNLPSLLDTPVHILNPKSVSLSTDVGIPYSRSRTLAPDINYSRVAKTAAALELERKARVEAERAMKYRKVFTIIGPYHCLRLALRRRGWVEKFVNAPMPGELTATIQKKKTEDDNDDDGTAELKVKPWEEEGGLFGMMSHIVRNCTPTFVFTIRSVDVDSRIMKSGQLVNHFGKAKNITTKTGLCQNLRNVLWYDKTDPDTFYPRCYKMDEHDEKESFIADYRLTACVGFVKHFIEKYKYQLSDEYPENSDNKENQPSLAQDIKDWPSKKISISNNNNNTRDPLTQRTDSDPGQKKRGDSGVTVSVRSDSVAKLSMTHSGGDGNNAQQPPAGEVTLSVQNLPPVFVQKRLKKGGQVPDRALEIACEQCLNYIRSKEHDDIDLPADKNGMTEGQWDQFLVWYYQFVHEGGDVKGTPNEYADCKAILVKYQEHHLQYEMEGFRNMWIIKPGAKSRGRGIELSEKLGSCLNLVDKDSSAVIQKYIERPLLVYNTKFDIRQWFLVTDWNPLTVWFYKDSYLRFCSQQFTNDDFHVSIHLANNSVQKNFQNGPRSENLPDDNMWTSDEFDDYLRQNGGGGAWHEKIVPGMKKAILCSLLCSQEHIECRKSAYELYGADFMIGDNMETWLLEINSSPSMARNTRATTKLVDTVLEDTCKVVLDRKENKNADTGGFELLYQQKYVNDPPPVDLSLAVTGKRIKKKDKYGARR